MPTQVLRNNFFDFQKVTRNDLIVEQSGDTSNIALTNDLVAGSGVLLDFPTEKVIFDSSSLSAAQQGFVAVNTFDGRGILASGVASSDLTEGTQVSVKVSGARLTGIIKMGVTIIGKTFDQNLIYEHLEFLNNDTRVTKNHFIEITNILFQNFKGNLNTSVDGQGSFDVGGTVLVTEASSYKVSHDSIAAEQVSIPDIPFRNFKTYDISKLLNTVLEEAIGASNDVDDLNVNTTTTLSRTFAENASTETIFAQKFQMNGDNIQKVSLLLGLSSGSNWSGTLVVGIRPLLTSVTSPTDFIPDNEIDFDPDSVPIEEISLTQTDLADKGVALTSAAQIVDFVFTDSQISNHSLSGLVDGNFYVITVRRTGSSSTGSVFLEEALNASAALRKLTVFQGSSWTDVSTSTLWFQVWNNSVRVASGTMYDQGIRLPALKTKLGNDGVPAQNFIEDVNLTNSSEGTENYLIGKKGIELSLTKSHPNTGDSTFTRVEDVPKFSVLEQSELIALMVGSPDTVVLGRVKDNNSRSNPTITGTIDYPGLVVGNVIDIINPGTDLLTQNVVGSIITPDILQPSLKYRITSQVTHTDLYGDVDGDVDIDIFDASRLTALDGYQVYLTTTGTYSSTQQKAALVAGQINILEVLRADLDQSDGNEITSSDLTALNNFLNNGTAFPNGKSSFSRVRLEVESILAPQSDYGTTALSTLQLEVDNVNLIDPTKFSLTADIDFSISFIPTWDTSQVEVLDLRRFVTTTFLDFTSADLQSTIESGGKNNLFVPGDLFLTGSIKTLSSDSHPLDIEMSVIELELPAGNTEGELNLFSEYISGKMKFSDGTFVAASALSNEQVRFEVSVSSHVKNVSDGINPPDGYVDFDGYNDGYGANADEAIGISINHNTGILRIRAFNIVNNALFPELRTRISITVNLRKSGYLNSPTLIDASSLQSKLIALSP